MRSGWVAYAAMTVLAAGLASCSGGSSVEDPWVRLPAVPGRPAAAYVTLHGGNSDDALVAVTAPAATRIELHQSMRGHGPMDTMHPVDRVPLPAGAKVRLSPGGTHAMIFGLSGDLRPGQTLPMTFRFAGGRTVAAEALLIAAGDPAP